MDTMLDKHGPLPLHIQLENIIIQKIEDEEWPANASIPSENELCKIYGISRMTVHSALNHIAEAGLVYRVPGKGTFVSPPKIVSTPPTRIGIREQLEQQGYETSTKIIGVEVRVPPAKAAKALGIGRSELIYIIRRVRYIKGEPLSYHISYIPSKLFPGLENQNFADEQMCDIMEKQYHCEIVRRLETLEAVTATPEEASLLSVRTACPLLLLENTVFTFHDSPVEFTKIIFRGDKIKLKLEFNKNQG